MGCKSVAFCSHQHPQARLLLTLEQESGLNEQGQLVYETRVDKINECKTANSTLKDIEPNEFYNTRIKVKI